MIFQENVINDDRLECQKIMKEIVSEVKNLLSSSFEFLQNMIYENQHLSKDEKAYMDSIRAQTNIKRLLLFLLLLLIVEIGNLVLGILCISHPVFKNEYLFANTFMIIVCMVFFLFIKGLFPFEKCSVKKLRIVYNGFWICFSLGIFIFSTLDLMDKNSLDNFIVLIALTAIVPLLNLKESLVLVIIDIVFQSIITCSLGCKFYVMQKSLFLLLIGFVMGQLFFLTYVSSNIKRKRSEISNKRLKKISETDSLTGLLNRWGLEKRLNKLWNISSKINSRVALAVIDIDYFKMYNDKYGHLKGDECLKAVADCIIDVFPQKNNMLCRFGGEEFVIIQIDIQDHIFIDNLLKIKRNIENKRMEAGQKTVSEFVTISIGVTIENWFESSDFEYMFSKADRALYMAKANGRNTISLNGEFYK